MTFFGLWTHLPPVLGSSKIIVLKIKGLRPNKIQNQISGTLGPFPHFRIHQVYTSIYNLVYQLQTPIHQSHFALEHRRADSLLENAKRQWEESKQTRRSITCKQSKGKELIKSDTKLFESKFSNESQQVTVSSSILNSNNTQRKI